jgi:hypothetical protein
VDGLAAGTTYCWKVVTRDGCGEVEGPLWTFTVAAATAPAFLRGDALADGRLDIADPIAVLGALFAGGTPLPCADAADADDDGALGITDAIVLLSHLFLAGPALPSPSTECGADPTPDGLGCEGGTACGG